MPTSAVLIRIRRAERAIIVATTETEISAETAIKTSSGETKTEGKIQEIRVRSNETQDHNAMGDRTITVATGKESEEISLQNR